MCKNTKLFGTFNNNFYLCIKIEQEYYARIKSFFRNHHCDVWR